MAQAYTEYEETSVVLPFRKLNELVRRFTEGFIFRGGESLACPPSPPSARSLPGVLVAFGGRPAVAGPLVPADFESVVSIPLRLRKLIYHLLPADDLHIETFSLVEYPLCDFEDRRSNAAASPGREGGD